MSLIEDYLEFCRVRHLAKKTGRIDLSEFDWFWPINLLPIRLFCQGHRQMEVIKPENPDVENYYDIITKETLDLSEKKTFIPIIQIPRNTSKTNEILEYFHELENGEIVGDSAYHLFLHELVDNIYQHSEFSNAYIMAQRYPKKEFFEICILDNGISIPGSYEKFGYRLKDDIEALDLAINGESTKEEGDRGYGIGTIIKIFSEGLKSEFLIILRMAALHFDNGGLFFRLDANTSFSGTLISVRVPYNNEGVNIYEYLE